MFHIWFDSEILSKNPCNNTPCRIKTGSGGFQNITRRKCLYAETHEAPLKLTREKLALQYYLKL